MLTYFLSDFILKKAETSSTIIILILGGIATILQHSLQLLGHELHQGLEVVTIVHLEGPQPENLCREQRDGGRWDSDLDSSQNSQ
jgi:hypothetical protein